MEKIGIVAGTVAFLGFLLFCTWHHSVGPGVHHPSDISPPAAAVIPPIASAVVPPSTVVIESPPVPLPLPTLEATPTDSLIPAEPTERTSKEQSHPQSLTPTLRSKVVEFYAESDRLTPKGRGTLNTLLPILRKNPNTHLEIAGHADNVGAQDYNLALSQRRAETVKNYFIARGVAEQHLVARGYGSSLPIADNATAEGRQRNRRTEIIVHSSAIGS
jgi:outer membrane protein OmpA-like peptidoglycan-associated protein